MVAVKGRRLAAFAVAGLLLAAPAGAEAGAAARVAAGTAPAGSGFVTFAEFIADVSRTHYGAALSAGRVGAVRGEAAFEQMRGHVLDMYKGVDVKHSYLSPDGYFDCVSVDSQPSVKALGGKEVAAPPPAGSGPPAADKAPGDAIGAPSALTLGDKDAFGHAISCGPGTIPMQRITMERLTKFADLRAFLAKEPGGGGGSRAAADPYVHHYAVGQQVVGNHGGQSSLALYNQAGDFSISQQWYINDTAGYIQTAEGGWIRYPQKFGDRSVTFIYFTADSYTSTGCYNLDCVGFVQTNRNWALGGGWSIYSTPGGAQYQFTMQWQWYQGNWWMFLQGAGAMEAVGYYPGYVYRGGPLASYANRSDFGGETARLFSTFAQMGSGYYAASGWTWAAYQHTIFYLVNGGSYWSSLWPTATVPHCYTINYTPASAGWNWGTFFYFGGPGGYC
ncbi:MAG TPA: neprosin family prolyl endopeptidase [Candidatus Limnocylindrales bacterium]